MLESENMYSTLSIASLGPATLTESEAYVHPKRRAPSTERRTNDISDIDGAYHVSKYERFTNKPKYQASDVPGSTPKQLIRPLHETDRNRPDFTLAVDDIDGTRYCIRDRMLSTKRNLDPLNPQYKLPSYKMAEPYQPQFIRDPMDTADIQLPSLKLTKTLNLSKDPLAVSDIDGAKADYRNAVKEYLRTKPPKDIMNTCDVSAYKRSYFSRTSRVTSIKPSYYMNGMVIEDDPRYSRPKSLPKEILDNHLLSTSDIPGATAGWIDPDMRPLREIRNITSVEDIEGAQADTLKRCLYTKRQTNPLYPVYQSLDDGEPLFPVIKPLIPPTLITKPTLKNTDVSPIKIATPKISTKSLPNLNLNTVESSFVPFDWGAGNTMDTEGGEGVGGLVSQRLSGRSSFSATGLQSSKSNIISNISNNSNESFSSRSNGRVGRVGTGAAGNVVTSCSDSSSSRQFNKTYRKIAEERKAEIEAVRMLK